MFCAGVLAVQERTLDVKATLVLDPAIIDIKNGEHVQVVIVSWGNGCAIIAS